MLRIVSHPGLPGVMTVRNGFHGSEPHMYDPVPMIEQNIPEHMLRGAGQLGGVASALSFFFWGAFFLAAGGAIGYAIGVERSVRGGFFKPRRR